MKTLVVIPTYLEAENIADVLRRVRSVAPHADVLVVDDSSSDGTADLARAAGEELGQIDVLVRPGKGGLGPAYRAGFEVGFSRGYEVLVQMDADLQHNPASLPELLARVEEGADIAIGSRYVPGGETPNWPFRRRLLSRVANVYASKVLGLKVHDATAGYRAYRADVLRVVVAEATKATGYGFQVELSYRAHRRGAKIVEVPITFNERVRGESKMSWRIIGEAASVVTWWGLRDRLFGFWRRRPEPVARTSSTTATVTAASEAASSGASEAPAASTPAANPDHDGAGRADGAAGGDGAPAPADATSEA
ncbi:MAG TPA: polyprenol monophosphomannose synthase [Acidimicrobiales bacterium]